MKKITKRVLLEEIQRINEIMGGSSKLNLNEQPSEFFEKLFRGGEEEVSNVVKSIEKSGIRGADDVASAFRSLIEKGLTKLTEEESLFLANVIRQIYPDISNQVRRSLTELLIPEMGPIRVGKLEDILANEKYPTERLHNYLVNNLGMENLTVLELQVWRDALKRTPSEIKIPTTVEVKPTPENITRPTELSPIITQELEGSINNEFSRIPEGGGGLQNPELPLITDITDPLATEFLNRKMAEAGVNSDKVSAKELLELMKEIMSKDRAALKAQKASSDAIKEAIQQNKTNPTTPTTPTTPTPKINPTLLERFKNLFKSEKSIDKAHYSMTALQIASICVDVYGTDKKFTEYENAFYGKNLGFWEIMGIKVLSRGLGGKWLFGVNVVLTVVDLLGMGYDLATYHPERLKKLSDEEKKKLEDKKKEEDRTRIADSTYNAEKERLRKISLDSLQQKFSDDSLVNAIRDKLKPNKPKELDSTGKAPLPKDIFK